MKPSLLLIAVLFSCAPEKAEDYVKKRLPGISFVEVLAISQSFWSLGYGCTYAVVRLGDDAPERPPASTNRIWIRTPPPSLFMEGEENWYPGREACLSGRPDVAGSGLEGYGGTFAEIISRTGAWVRMSGGAESQILQIYASNEGLALHLRFGD